MTKNFGAALVAVFLLSSVSGAWMGLGGSADYSREAGSTYICASSGTFLSPAGLSVSSPTLSLYNPWGSGKYLVILDIGINLGAAPAAAAGFVLAYSTPSIGISSMTGYAPYNSAAVNVTNAYVGQSTGTFVNAAAQCKVYGIMRQTPYAMRYLGGTTGAASISGVQLIDQTDGKVVVPPGVIISIQSTSAASLMTSITWREDPL